MMLIPAAGVADQERSVSLEQHCRKRRNGTDL